MATEGTQMIDGSRVAGADLSALQYCFVNLDANGDVVGAGAGAWAYGVLQNAPAAGEPCTICILGLTKLKMSAANNEGVAITPTAASLGVTASADTQFTAGRALTAAGGANELVDFFMNQEGKVA